MRIAMFHELHFGGARRAVHEIAKYLKKKHIVDLYYVSETKEYENRDHFSVIRCYHFQPTIWMGKNPSQKVQKDTIDLLRLFFLHREIAKEIDRKKYDVVFIHGSQYTQSPFLLRLLKSKKVYYCQEPLRIIYDSEVASDSTLDVFRRSYEHINKSIRKIIDKKNIKFSDIVLTNSYFTCENCKKYYSIDPIVCYLGVDTNFFKPSKGKKKIDLLYIGSKTEVDGYFFFQEVVKRMKIKIKTQIVDWTEERISEEKLRQYYQQSKIVLCLGKNEPFGLSALEAMSCEDPVVAVDEGGYKETVIHGKTGYLLSRDPMVFAKKIQTLLKNNSLRERLGKKGRIQMQYQWTWQKTANNLEALFKKYLQ